MSQTGWLFSSSIETNKNESRFHLHKMKLYPIIEWLPLDIGKNKSFQRFLIREF